jgi:hypothetical protein
MKVVYGIVIALPFKLDYCGFTSFLWFDLCLVLGRPIQWGINSLGMVILVLLLLRIGGD